jgi:hypothetical protein
MRFRSNLWQERRLPAAELAQARHESYFQQYIEWLDQQDANDAQARHVTIIARSPASAAVRAMTASAEALAARGVTMQAVFAELEPDETLRQACETLSALCGESGLGGAIRWAKTPNLKDAHEQCMFGGRMSWSGDSMRRQPDQRNGLDLFEVDSPHAVRLGALAFDAIWAVSDVIPESRLRGDVNGKPHASFADPAGERLVASFPFLNRRDGSTLLRH